MTDFPSLEVTEEERAKWATAPTHPPTDPQLRDMHLTSLHAQMPAFGGALWSMMDLCNSWFTNIQGFNRDNFDGDCMLIVTELAEAVEADRKAAKDSHLPDREGRDVEIADALVRLLHLAAKYKLDLPGAFHDKMVFNLSRPFRHGKEY